MKVIIFFLVIACSNLNSWGQDLSCEDFKNGRFLVPADSIITNSYIIERQNGKQTELNEYGSKTFINIIYIDDCNYILIKDEMLNQLDEIDRLVNNSGGMQVKVTKIKGDTLFYNGLIENDTLRFEQKGRIIKVK